MEKKGYIVAETYALTMGTTMTMIKITIPTPTMILHFMSFHLQGKGFCEISLSIR